MTFLNARFFGLGICKVCGCGARAFSGNGNFPRSCLQGVPPAEVKSGYAPAKKRRRAPHLIDRAEVSLRSEPNGLRDAVALQEMSVGTSEQDGKRVAEAISFRACPCRRPVAAECVRCKAPLCLESCGTRSGEHLFPFCEGCEVEAFYQEDAQPPPPEWLPPGWQVGRSITCKPDRFGRPRKAFKCMCSRIFLNPSDIQYHIPRCALSQTASAGA